jgi:hypothetical protein
MKIGDRVVLHADVGYIEELDGDWATVRFQTPHDSPSVLSTICRVSDLRDGTNVVPRPRPKLWWRESREFCAIVRSTCEELLK